MPCVMATVCDNPRKYVLNTLQCAHVETGQTPEERVAVIKVTTHQGITVRMAASSVKYCLIRLRSRI